MGGNGMDTEAGRIDVVSCGVGFPKDAETLGLIGGADVVFGSRALLGACPVEARLTRIIGAKAREDAADALALCRAGRHVVVLASGDALYHGFGGTLSGMARPDDAIVHHPGITAFQALFHRLGLPWQDARLFSAHSGEALPARAIAEAPLSVAYAGSRYPAHAIAQAVLKLHPASAERAAVIAERLGSPKEHLVSGPLADLARTECGPTSILLLLPNHWGYAPHSVARFALDEHPGPREDAPAARSIPAPILTLGLPEEDYERENNLITASDVRAVILSRLRLPAWGTLWDIGAGSGSVGLEAAGLRPNLNVVGIERKPERGAIIERNRARMGIPNYTLHIGDALGLIRASSIGSLPSSTPGLPRPSTPDAPYNETSVREAGNREHPMPAYPCGETPKAYNHRAKSDPSSACGIVGRKEWTAAISPASSIGSLPSGTPGLPRPNTHDALHNETSVREAGNREHPMPASPCGKTPKAYSHRAESEPSSPCGIADRKEWTTAISPASSIGSLPSGTPGLPRPNTPGTPHNETPVREAGNREYPMPAYPCGNVPPSGQDGPSLSSPYGGTPAAQPPHQSKVLGKRGDGGPGEGERTTLLQKGFLSPSPGISPPSLLPPPDRIFIGGGGRGLPELLEACMERLAPGGIMVVSAVTLESFHTLYAWSPEQRTGLCSLNIAHEQPIAGTSRHLKQQNTIYLFTFQKEIMP